MTAAQLLHSALEKYATQPGATTGMKPPSAPAAPTGGLNAGGLNKGLGAGPSPAGGGLAKPPALTAPKPTMAQPAMAPRRPLPPTYERWPDGGPKPHHIQQLIADGKELGAREGEIQQRGRDVLNMMNNADPLGERTQTGRQSWTAPNAAEFTTLSPQQAAAGQRFVPQSYVDNGAGGMTTVPDYDAAQQNLNLTGSSGLTGAQEDVFQAGQQQTNGRFPYANSGLMSNHPPGMYSQLSDGTYIARADIPNTAGENGYKVVPVDYGAQVENAAPPTNAAASAPQSAQPAPIVSNTQGTMTDTAGQPVATTPKQPKGPEAFVDAIKARSEGKEPAGGVIDMTKPLDPKAVEAHLGDVNVPPEQKQKFLGDLTEKLKHENPQYYEGFNDMQAGRTDTEAAKAYQGRMEQAKNELIQQQVQADPEKAATPQGFGEIVNNAMSTFQGMHPAMQAMVGIGLPVGLIGIMSSMFGQGGMGMGILGALGLGAGVIGGAAGGLFGQGAQNMAGDAAYQVGSFLGMAPEARSGSLDALRGEDAISRMTAGPSQDDQTAAFNDPAGHAKKVQQQLDQAGQVRKLMNLPEGMRPQFLRNIDPSLSEEDAVIAARNAAQFSTQMDEPDSAVSKMLQQGQEFVANPHEVVNQKADEHIRGKLPWGTQWAAPAVRSGYQWWNNIPSGPQEDAVKGANMHLNKLIEKWAFNDMDAKELSDLKAEKAKGVPYRVDEARREHELNLRNQAATPDKKTQLVMTCMKSARCWAGYEPVPGKKPYSNDSCRPAGSKKKKDTKKKTK